MGARALRPVLCCVLLAAGASAAQEDASPASRLVPAGPDAAMEPSSRALAGLFAASDTDATAPDDRTGVPGASATGATDRNAAQDAPAARTASATDGNAAQDVPAARTASGTDTTTAQDPPAAQPTSATDASAAQDLPAAQPASGTDTTTTQDPPAAQPASATDASAAQDLPAAQPASATDASATDASGTDTTTAQDPPAAQPASATDSTAPQDAPIASPATSALTPAAKEDAPTAKDATAPKTSDVLRDGRGVWTHDQYRYGKKWNLVGGLVLRTLMDLVAIPSGMVAWDWLDWTVFSSVVASTVILSLPTYPSPDVALQRMIQRSLGGADHFKIWSTYGDMAIWMGIWGGVASMFLYGMTADAPEFVEVSALAVEAFALAQVYHLGIKALTGREGPKDEVTPGETTGEGRYFGPSAFTRLFPSGTPSGHVATMYAILSVVMHYFNTPAVWIGLNTFALLFSVTIIADNYHWASDVIIGAALGFCVGRWVVHHRSTKFRNDEGGLPRRVLATLANHAAIAPMVLPNGGVGAAVVFRF